jgi:hypothetical protein
MKRAFTILGVILLTAVITYLALTKHLAEERAARLDRALLAAEEQVMVLEEEVGVAKGRLAEVTARSEAARRAADLARAKAAAAEGEPRPAAAARPLGTPPPPTAAHGAPAPAERLAGAKVETAPPMVIADGGNPAGPATVVVEGNPWLRYAAASGTGWTNLVRIEGTSTIHRWQVEGHLIGGSAEFGAGFPVRSGEAPRVGKVAAKVNVFIPVRSLKSVESNGSPYSDAMDEIMYGKLLAEKERRITYTLTSLALKEPPERREWSGPLHYLATGDLAVAGVTNAVTMPVEVLLSAEGRIRVSGSLPVKMTSFHITPPSPNLGGVSIKTGDEIFLRFVWWVRPADGGPIANRQ